MKKAYWAVGLNFDYDIICGEVNVSDYGSCEGPFDTLEKAKKQVRKWIANDRYHLSVELDAVNSLKASKI